MDFLPPRRKARDVLLLLDSGIYILQLMVIWAALEALYYITLFCVVYTHLVYLFVYNSTTTNAADSVPPRGKAWDGLLFLDSSRLPLAHTRAAQQALHYRTFVLFSMDIRTPSWYTFSLATGKLQTLRDSVPPGPKAQYAVLFLDSGML